MMNRTIPSRLASILCCGALAGACGAQSPDSDLTDAAVGTPDAIAIVDAATIDASQRFDAAPILDATPRPDAVPGFTCASAVPLVSGASFLGDTELHTDQSSASCSVGSQSARDTAFRLALPSEPTDLIARVTVDPKAVPRFDAVVSVQTSCGDENSEAACSDFDFSEEVEALGLSGDVFIAVDGTSQFGGAPHGAYQLDVFTRSISSAGETCDLQSVTSRCATGLLCEAGICVAESLALACNLATELGVGQVTLAQTHAFQPDLLQGSCAFKAAAGAGEAIYSFTVSQPSSVEITTDLPGTNFDTVLYLLSTCEGSELACADDVNASSGNFRSTLSVPEVPAGDYLLVVDGASIAAASGHFELLLAVTPLP